MHHNGASLHGQTFKRTLYRPLPMGPACDHAPSRRPYSCCGLRVWWDYLTDGYRPAHPLSNLMDPPDYRRVIRPDYLTGPVGCRSCGAPWDHAEDVCCVVCDHRSPIMADSHRRLGWTRDQASERAELVGEAWCG